MKVAQTFQAAFACRVIFIAFIHTGSLHYLKLHFLIISIKHLEAKARSYFSA